MTFFLRPYFDTERNKQLPNISHGIAFSSKARKNLRLVRSYSARRDLRGSILKLKTSLQWTGLQNLTVNLEWSNTARVLKQQQL